MTSLMDQLRISLPDGWRDHLPATALTTDSEKMTFVISLAQWNVRGNSGGPFAAAVFSGDTNKLISIGVNQVVSSRCSLAHAEAMAIALAQQRLQTHDLCGHGRLELVTSGQPCVQCFGMLWWSGITRLVTAARAEDIEELTSFSEGPLPGEWQQKLSNRDPLPPVSVVQDVCREQSRQLLKQYTDTGGQNYSPGKLPD